MMYQPRNYDHLETTVLTEALGLIDAQIWSAEDTLRALNITRDAMMGVLADRSPHAEG